MEPIKVEITVKADPALGRLLMAILGKPHTEAPEKPIGKPIDKPKPAPEKAEPANPDEGEPVDLGALAENPMPEAEPKEDQKAHRELETAVRKAVGAARGRKVGEKQLTDAVLSYGKPFAELSIEQLQELLKKVEEM